MTQDNGDLETTDNRPKNDNISIDRSPKWPRTVTYHRLREEILVFEKEWQTATVPEECQKHQTRILDLIDEAWKALQDRKYNTGWAALNGAIRHRILCLDRDNLENWAIAVATESQDKLSDWRKDSAHRILPFSARDDALDLQDANAELELARATEEKFEKHPASHQRRIARIPDTELRARTFKVQWLLDGRSQNMYIKQAVILNRALILLVCLVALVVAAMIIIEAEGLDFLPKKDSTTLPGLLLVSVFGAMGASFSSLRSLFGTTTRKIPEFVTSAWFTGARPCIGASAAIIVYLAHVANIINLVGNNEAAMLVLAFVAGFSDALVVRVVGSVTNKSE